MAGPWNIACKSECVLKFKRPITHHCLFCWKLTRRSVRHASIKFHYANYKPILMKPLQAQLRIIGLVARAFASTKFQRTSSEINCPKLLLIKKKCDWSASYNRLCAMMWTPHTSYIFSHIQWQIPNIYIYIGFVAYILGVHSNIVIIYKLKFWSVHTHTRMYDILLWDWRATWK